MNIQPKLVDSVDTPEDARERGHCHRHASIASGVPMVCIHHLRIMTRTRSIPHDGQITARSLAEARSEDGEILSNSQSNLDALDVLLSRYRQTLLLVAYRVLGDHNQAEDAVQRCLMSSSWNVPHFETEGAFRSWLIRVLIDKALIILREKEWVAHILRANKGQSYPIDPSFPEELLS